jgi:hypothetical protein
MSFTSFFIKQPVIIVLNGMTAACCAFFDCIRISHKILFSDHQLCHFRFHLHNTESMLQWAQYKANSTMKGVQESISKMGTSEGDKTKTAREQECKERSSELKKRRNGRAQIKLRSEWEANRARAEDHNVHTIT